MKRTVSDDYSLLENISDIASEDNQKRLSFFIKAV